MANLYRDLFSTPGTGYFVAAGLLLATLLLLVGVSALVKQRATEPPITLVTRSATGSVIRMTSVQVLTLLMMAMGVIVGTVDIVSIAWAGQLGHPAAASLVLSAYAVGSCIAGLAYGAHMARSGLTPRCIGYYCWAVSRRPSPPCL